MHCDIRLRVSVTCTFTIKHGTHVPVVTCSHLYDAHRLQSPFNTTDCRGVRGSEDRVSDSGFRGRRFESRRRQILVFIYREVYRICSDFYLYSRLAFFMCYLYLVRLIHAYPCLIYYL